MIGAIFCLMCSSIYHLFSALSPTAQTILSRLDYSAVALLILGSSFPPIVYGFACNTKLMIIYMSFTSFFCFLTFVVNMLPSADKPKYRWLRGTLFVIVGLLAGASPAHAAIVQ
jgi:adiponectin receptor